MYNRLKSILSVRYLYKFKDNKQNANAAYRKKSPLGGPTSLNIVARKNEINKINQENNAFL